MANQPLTIGIESMGVEIETRIGAMAFRLRGAAKAVVPALELRPMTLNDGLLVMASVDAESPAYLVVDHRRQCADQPASVEFWEPIGAGEGALGGLFAFCDPATPVAAAPEVVSLDDLRALFHARADQAGRVR